MMKSRLLLTGLLAAAGLALAVAAKPVQAQSLQKVSLALPATNTTDSFAYVALDMGFWKDLGLDVDLPFISGTLAAQSVLTGDVQFSISSGPVLLTSAAKGQKMIAVGQLLSALYLELVVSKKVADESGLDVKTSTEAQRARALKGKTIAVSGAANITDNMLIHILHQGGLDPDKDITKAVAPLTPAINVALREGKIDGYSGVTPYSTAAAKAGYGVVWISGIRHDMPEIDPFVYSLITTRTDYCPKNPDICKKFMAGATRALNFMHDNRAKSLEIVSKRFPGVDPAEIEEGFDSMLALVPPAFRFDEKAWAHTQDFAVEVGLMTPAMKFKSFDDVYTNAYLPAAN